MNDHDLLRWLIPAGVLMTPLRNTAGEPLTLWDYLFNGSLITVAVILWVALKR